MVPQYSGTPGWILLSHSKDGQPECLFVDKHDHIESIPIVLDERMFSDTILRVVRLSKYVFIAYDLCWLNGVHTWEKLAYPDRKKKLDELLELFHVTALTALLPIEHVHGISVRGHEHYNDQPGTIGIFLPADE